MPNHISLFAAPIVCLLLAVSTARATVSLALSDNDATPTSATVAPGGQVLLTVRLVSTAEQTTGLDYYLRASGPAGLFTLADRSLAGSAYPIPYFDDTLVEAPAAAALLDPDHDLDLGGSVPNVLSPLGAGTHTVANLTLTVSPSAPGGIYTLSTFSNPNTGWVGGDFSEAPFNAHGSFTIAVPEPANAALLAIAAAGALSRRGRGRITYG